LPSSLHEPPATQVYTPCLHDALPICALHGLEFAPSEEPVAEIEALREPARVEDDRLVAAQAAAALLALGAARRALEEIVDHRQRSEEHTSELQSHLNLVCRLLLEKRK